jgi:undecaprenyl-diphosphatase
MAWIGLVLVGWGLGELSTSAVQASDADAVRDVASGRSSLLVTLAHAASFVGSGYVIVPLAIVVCAILCWRRRRADAYAVALSAAGAIALSSVVKIMVGRARPPVHHLEAVSSGSFPSGHATQSTAFYLTLLMVLVTGKPRSARPAAAVAAVLLIIAIATSRVYLGVHYPSDVIAGMLLGGTWSVISRRASITTFSETSARAQPSAVAGGGSDKPLSD